MFPQLTTLPISVIRLNILCYVIFLNSVQTTKIKQNKTTTTATTTTTTTTKTLQGSGYRGLGLSVKMPGKKFVRVFFIPVSNLSDALVHFATY